MNLVQHIWSACDISILIFYLSKWDNENRNTSLDTWSWSSLSMEQTTRITSQKILKSIQILFNFTTSTIHALQNFTNNKIARVFFNSDNKANIFLFKVRNRNTKKRYKICSNLTKKSQNDVSDLFLVFLFLTLSK